MPGRGSWRVKAIAESIAVRLSRPFKHHWIKCDKNEKEIQIKINKN
jgi:hypothetical protein